jgi:CubicO group peptidase (beta-lactamase class C family)
MASLIAKYGGYMASKNVSQLLDTYMQTQQEVNSIMGSVLVVKGEEVLLSKSYGKANLEHDIDNTPDTKFRIGSISKQFTAAAILKLQEQGLLNVHAPLSTYLPEYPRGNDITLHHLLTHSAGIPSFVSFNDYLVVKKLPTTPSQIVDRFKELPLEFEPGTKFNYSTSGYTLLAHLIEHISGKSYADFLEDEFFRPLELNNTGEEKSELLIPQRASGYNYIRDKYWNADYVDMSVHTGGGSLYSTPRDLYQWTRYLHQGRVVGPTSFEAMKTPFFLGALTLADGRNTGYGYGLVIGNWEDQQGMGHNGGIEGFKATALYYPEPDLTIIILCNVENTCGADIIAAALSNVMFGKDVPLVVKRVATYVDPAILTRYVGDYELRPDFILSIHFTNNQLTGQFNGGREFELYATSETDFFTVFFEGATFLVEEGKVNGLLWPKGGNPGKYRKLEPKS